MRQLSLSLLFFATSAFACTAETWTAGGQKLKVCFDEKVKTVISESCIDKKCDAREFKEKIKDFHLPGKSSENPGSRYCRFLKGKVLLARNERGSENAFCQGKDKSVINLSGLTP